MKLKEILLDRRARYGSYSVVMTIIALAILVAVNLVVGEFDIKWDLSSNQLQTITTETVDFLNTLDEDVTLYTLFRTGAENETYVDLLGQYASHSPHIKIENRDPYLYPTFVNQYSEDGHDIPVNSIIVQGASRFRVVSGDELVKYTMDYQTYTQSAESLQLEPLVTNAIRNVVSGRTPKVYALTGHDEQELSSLATEQMKQEGYIYETVNLVTGGEVPEDCDILMIATPRRDITPDERKKIDTFMAAGGSLMVMSDLNGADMSELNALLGGYGLELDGSIIIEGDAGRTIQGQPFFCFPIIEDFEIGSPLTERKLNVLTAFSQGVTPLDVRKQSVKLYPLLTTSDKAYGKVNTQSATIEKEEGDLSGPLHLAVASEDLDNYESPIRVVALGSSSLLDSQINSAVGGGNLDFFMNSLGWLAGQEKSVYIRAKSLQVEALQINASQQAFLLLLCVVLIPLAIIITGIVRWLRRRHK